ncbi:hypothetical protein QCA50_006033 [Cerrena zonata]|uniref:Uncharacterized protein n=1 Tax=Cerrena zonata TaxID=2478898 RepID=A0AAW0GC61_9APHY
MSANTYFNVVLRVLLLIGFFQHQVNASAQTETDNDIDWFDCPFPTRHSTKCGHFTIPLDWNNTDGPKGRLAVTKFNSDDDQAEKRGIMFVHRGPLLGPVDTWLEDRGQFLLDMLLDQGFDVVTFDLRGSTARWQGDHSGSNHEFFSIPAASQCLNVTARDELTRCYGRIPKKVNFDALRECRIKGCLSPQFNPDRSNFKYMGTAASVRDLVALSGHLQGPNTPVNFWGISHGSLIGSYLINSEFYIDISLLWDCSV